MRTELNQAEYDFFTSFLLEFGREHTFSMTLGRHWIPENTNTHSLYYGAPIKDLFTLRDWGLMDVCVDTRVLTLTDKCMELLKEYSENGEDTRG